MNLKACVINLGSGFVLSLLLRFILMPNFLIIGILCVSTNSISVPSGSSTYEKCPLASPISNLSPLSHTNGCPVSSAFFLECPCCVYRNIHEYILCHPSICLRIFCVARYRSFVSTLFASLPILRIMVLQSLTFLTIHGASCCSLRILLPYHRKYRCDHQQQCHNPINFIEFY